MLDHKCLLIDSGATLEQPLTTLVTSFGLVASEYDGSNEALAALAGNPEDLIVINTTAQSEKEAIHLIRRIREISPAVTIVVLTDRIPADIEQNQPLMSAADLVLSKPCTVYQFQEAVLPLIRALV